MKVYTNKSNARRAAKKEFGTNFEQLVDFNQDENNQWYYTKKRKAKLNGIKRKSDIENPCSEVWNIAEAMNGASRKEVIEACVNAGIAFYTARTQYQRWSQAHKDMRITPPQLQAASA